MSRVLNGIVIALCCFFALVVAYPLLSGQPLSTPDRHPASSDPAPRLAPKPSPSKAPAPDAAANASKAEPVSVAQHAVCDEEEDDDDACEAPSCKGKGKRRQCEPRDDGILIGLGGLGVGWRRGKE